VNVCIPPLFNDRLAGATVTLLAVGGGVPPPPLLVLPQEFTNEKNGKPDEQEKSSAHEEPRFEGAAFTLAQANRAAREIRTLASKV